MSLSLQELVVERTADEQLEKSLKSLQGIGYTQRTGFSPGTVTLEGTPTSDFTMKVKVIAAGNLGAGTYQYSTDGGQTYSATSTIPAGGTTSLGGTGLTLVFADGPVGGGDSFRAGDILSIDVRRSTLPVTSWQVGSTPRTLLENDAVALVELRSLVGLMARGGLLLEAKSDWLTLLASQLYKVDRAAGVTAQGYVRLDDTASGGPHTITANQLWFGTPGGKRFNNTTGFTLAQGSFVVIPVQAESPGAEWNVAVGEINQMVSVLPGVAVSNPIYSNGTWLTRSGSNDESDESLIARCQSRWPQLSQGATDQVYTTWAKEADSSVTRTRVAASGTAEGTVDILLAGTSGPVSPATVAAVESYILPKKPLTVAVSVQSATGVNVTVTATVYVRAGYQASAQTEGTANVERLLRELDIGSVLYVNNIIEELSTPQGVRNVVLSAPVADVALSSTQVATLTLNLTFQVV